MSELTLYTNTMSRGNTVDLLLNLLAVPYNRVELAFNEQMHTKEYLAINPMAKVPALVDGDNIITETAAICLYLADKFIEKGLAPEFNSPERAPYYRWFFFTAGPIEAAFTAHMMGLELSAEEQKMSGFGSFKQVMDCLETGLANAAPYICGQQFTAVDVYIGCFLAFLIQHNLIEISPTVQNYFDAISRHADFNK
ncbi:glutathione S-transferase family protein [Providencia sneebia]|uniref:Glutathione S-transferase n=1 Tax=Providencia sneebia DSM 19967 TaxID=1141660 RepID=K8W6L0_9GAMM|nr:glutathione S-transferase family protein [Providencia sneebia]EKT53102.1 glutathione S-transferase [Providencia sneebia DSM 19967]